LSLRYAQPGVYNVNTKSWIAPSEHYLKHAANSELPPLHERDRKHLDRIELPD